MANPTSSPASTETYLTPTNVHVPTPSATFDLAGNGDLPNLPGVSSQLGASESGAVKLVGQADSSGSNSTSEDDEAVLRDDTKKQIEEQANSASGLVNGAGLWVGGVVIMTGFAVLELC